VKRKLVLIASTIALLALMIPASVILAQNQASGTATTSQPTIKDSLAIVAPRAAAVGQPISATVFQCSDQTPVEGAGVWAFTPYKAEAVKQQISKLRGTLDAATVESTLGANGAFLGYTDASGKVWHTFSESGRFVLATYKAGYWPDWRIIAVGVKPVVWQALSIDAPRKANTGEQVTITVSERGTQEPVKDARVWALTREQAESLKNEIAASRQSGDQATLRALIEDSLNSNGIFLGSTNGSGKVHYKFEKAGVYILVTYKAGYWPGLKPIAVVPDRLSVSPGINTLPNTESQVIE
jgi:hypothetical protein